MRFPWTSPLHLPFLAISMEQGAIAPCCSQLAERSLAEVVDKGVLRTKNPITGVANPHGVVFVLKETEGESFVKKPNSRAHLATDCGAKHRQHRDVEVFAEMVFAATFRKFEK